jgi:putative glutathione S-transferase
MGLLQNGKWVDQWYDTKVDGGRFIRKDSRFRNWITRDGSPGPSGDGGFKAEPDRYHLYVSYACPWAHRTLIFRTLKGLEDMVTLSVVNWFMGEDGWAFNEAEGVFADTVNNADFLHQLYTKATPNYSGRVTVPVLWDKKTETIVSNESSEIIRMFNSAFDDVGAKAGDYYPALLHAEIDALNARIYDTVNNGVYKAGFATTQDAYNEAVMSLFGTLDWLEDRLATQRYLNGPTVTEADWRLFTTLVRFDPVYVGHFKCNLKRITDYPNLWGYVRDLYQHPGVAGTVHMDHIKLHYYKSHETINPTRIVPTGPNIDFMQPHQREQTGDTNADVEAA